MASMNRADRTKAQQLESAMREFDTGLAALKNRALSRLTNAGYGFQTIEQARARLRLQRANPSSGQAELDSVARKDLSDPSDHQPKKEEHHG